MSQNCEDPEIIEERNEKLITITKTLIKNNKYSDSIKEKKKLKPQTQDVLQGTNNNPTPVVDNFKSDSGGQILFIKTRFYNYFEYISIKLTVKI